MLGVYKEQAPKMNMLYKLIPSGLFKTKLRDRKSKNRQIQTAPSFNIENVDISNSHNEKRSRRHSKSKYDSELNMASKDAGGKTVVTSSLLLYEGARKNMGILLREESPLLDNGMLRVVSIGSPGPAATSLLLPDFLLDVNLKLINTNNSFVSAEDLWSYNPEEGHSTGARKTVHFG